MTGLKFDSINHCRMTDAMTLLSNCRTKMLVLALMIFAGGCWNHIGMAKNNITPFGPDTYTLSYAAFRGKDPAAVRTIVFKAANEYCSENNKVFLPKNEDKVRNSVELIFRCLNPGDPELTRANWETRPDTVIEDRRNK